MLNEKKLQFCELYANKESLKLNHQGIAERLDISTKTIQRWLKEEEVIQEINKICASNLDRMLPSVVHNTEAMLSSSSANDRLKGQESFFKLQEKINRTQEANIVSRELKIVEKLVSELWSNLGDVLGAKLFIDTVTGVVVEHVIKKGYDTLKVEDINKFCKEHGIE